VSNHCLKKRRAGQHGALVRHVLVEDRDLLRLGDAPAAVRRWMSLLAATKLALPRIRHSAMYAVAGRCRCAVENRFAAVGFDGAEAHEAGRPRSWC
jgi:hypothetical protein